MTKLNSVLLINIVLFQCAWFALVLGFVFLGMAMTIMMFFHLLVTSIKNKEEVLFCLIIMVFGSFTDAVLVSLDVYSFTRVLEFNFSDKSIPIWLVTLWLAFSLTLNHSLKWLLNIPWLFMLLLSVFGPASYYAGSQLNPSQIQLDQQFIFLSFIQWTVIGAVILISHYYLLGNNKRLIRGNNG